MITRVFVSLIVILNLLVSCTGKTKSNNSEFNSSDIIAIDTHNHMDVPFDTAVFNKQVYNLESELKKSGFSAIVMTFCVDRPKLDSLDEAFRRFMLSLDEMDIMLKNNHIIRALNYKDVQEAHKQNQPFVIQSVEGGHFIENNIDRIEIAYNRGLRHLGLLHDNPSFVPLGDIYTNAPQFGGLTEAGINVIKECNRLGILVDLTHCSNEAIDDAIKTSTKPILISHTGLDTQLGNNERMAKMMMPRLISKEQAKKVADADGVIGVWTHLADSPVDYAKNIKAMVDVVGIDHVCIGTDTKMALPSNENERFGHKTNQSWDNMEDGFFYEVKNALKELGFNQEQISKISGGNYLRIFKDATSL